MSATWDSKSSKATPVNADEILIIDTEDSRNQKRATLTSLPVTISDNSVTDAKIATHVSTKITGLAPQTQPLLLNGNFINLSTITLQQVIELAVLTIADDIGSAGLRVENSDGFIQLINGTGGTNSFAGALEFQSGGSNTRLAQIISNIPVSLDTGTTPTIRIEGRNDDSSVLVNRPILAVYNFSTKVFEIAADGTQNFQGNTLTDINILESNNVSLPNLGFVRMGSTEALAWRNPTNSNNSFITINSFNEFDVALDGISEYVFGQTEADFKTNDIKNLNQLKWRNNANTADLVLTVNALDELVFDGGTVSIPAGPKTEGPVSFLNNAETQFLILDTNAADQLTFEGNVIPNMKSGMESTIADNSTRNVVFTTAFASTPQVTISQNSTGEQHVMQIESVSTTGFTINIIKDHPGGNDTVDVSWIATDIGNL